MMMIVFDYAVANGASDRFNCEKKMAGKDWLKAFCQRQNLSLRKPEQCSLGMAIGFNQVQCGTFFENLKLCYERKKSLTGCSTWTSLE
jgi:hypothetical protein